MCSNIAILGPSRLVQSVRHFFQIFKQTIRHTVCLEIANFEALIDNIQGKIVYCKEQIVLHI